MKMLLLPFTVTMLLAGVIQRSRLLFTQNIAIITKFREGRGKQDLVNYAVFEKEDGVRGETILNMMMGCTGMYWAVLGCIGLYWAVLGCTGMNWAVLGCTGVYWT